MVPAAIVPPAPMALMKPVVLKKPADFLFLGARTLLPLFFVGQRAVQGLHSSFVESHDLWSSVHMLLRSLLPLLF